MTQLELDTELAPRGPAAAIALTDAQVAALGGGGRAPVRVTIGERSCAARIGRMGGENLVGLSKAARAELGVEIGQAVHAVVALDEQPRTVEVPDDLAAALAADPAARVAFDALAPSHRKEHVRSVLDAKKPETRARRIAAVLAAVMPG